MQNYTMMVVYGDAKRSMFSTGGAKIRIEGRLAINSWVVLVIERLGTFPGEVRWQDKGLAGISFLEDAAVVEERLQLISPTKEI